MLRSGDATHLIRGKALRDTLLGRGLYHGLPSKAFAIFLVAGLFWAIWFGFVDLYRDARMGGLGPKDASVKTETPHEPRRDGWPLPRGPRSTVRKDILGSEQCRNRQRRLNVSVGGNEPMPFEAQ